MTPNSYTQPPIIEAVIEICFANPHDKSKIEKLIKKQKQNYVNYQKSINHKLKIDVSNTQKNEPIAKDIQNLVHRLSSEDITQQLLLYESTFVVTQLAPYCGWDAFINRFIRDWALWKKCMGFNEIKQIGVRYINRLDIPVSGPIIEFPQYVNIYPKIPEILPPNMSYAIHVKIPINELKSVLALNTAVVKSPLINHMSLVIDQDIVKTTELPQNDESIYSYLDEVHAKKNEVFESCITDKARELFNR